jgi:hypothetical protein
MTGTELAQVIARIAAQADQSKQERRTLAAFEYAAASLLECSLGADAFAAELQSELAAELERLDNADQCRADADYRRAVLGEDFAESQADQDAWAYQAWEER